MGRNLKAEVCVIGGGSGGFAAALRAAQSGCKTILVEKERILGGNSTVCGVNCWEPVAVAAYGLPGMRLLASKLAAASPGHPCAWLVVFA